MRIRIIFPDDSEKLRAFHLPNTEKTSLKLTKVRNLAYPKYLLDVNCAPPPSDKFLMDFGDARRRQVRTFQGERRPKTRKFIDDGLVNSSPFRLCTICGLDKPVRLVITLGYAAADDKLRNKKRKPMDELVSEK